MKRIFLITFYILFFCSFFTFSQNKRYELRPYKEIISSQAQTQKGFIKTHFLNDKVYLEIPTKYFEKEILFVCHQDLGLTGGDIIRFLEKGNDIQLVLTPIVSGAGNTIPLVENKLNISITPLSLPILAKNGSSYIIDGTVLFLNTPKPLKGGRKQVVNNATFINKVKAFNDVIEVNTTRTIESKNGPITSQVNFSLKLLQNPMMPRLHDYRMGFWDENFSVNFFDETVKASITRWKLVKKNKNEALSEPVKPIVFYFDSATPEKFKPYIEAGIYEWLPAFEAAGFKNAIIVKDFPVRDGDWSVNSLRYSVIRWKNNSKYRGHDGQGGATAKTIIDRRSGEIIKADIIIGEINGLVEDYFVRSSPMDKRAQQYPFPDDLMGELIQSLTAHETGHAFGLQDGNYGEFTYPFEKMRDVKWLQEMGHTPSVMNYARQNFIVQPEDKINPSLLQRKVGPTDIHSIKWAYKPIEQASSPEEELPFLEKIILEQDTNPWYRYTINGHDIGPGSNNEVVESDNPMKSAELGLKNLKRVMNLIKNATQNERDNKLMRRFYNKTLELWVDQMKYVTSLVGGYTIQYKSGRQDGTVYKFIPKSLQKEAVLFLNNNAFNQQNWMIRPDITERFIFNEFYNLTYQSDVINSHLDIVSQKQIKILSELLSNSSLRGLEENSINTKNSYKIKDFLKDLSKGLWKELNDKSILINPYRQELQIAYIALLTEILNRKNLKFQGQQLYSAYNKYLYSSYTRGVIYEELMSLKKEIQKSINRTSDIASKGHLNLCLIELNNIEK